MTTPVINALKEIMVLIDPSEHISFSLSLKKKEKNFYITNRTVTYTMIKYLNVIRFYVFHVYFHFKKISFNRLNTLKFSLSTSTLF